MACAPRQKSMATKIAYKVMGKPQNLQFKRSQWQEYVNKQLIAQESSRVR